MCNNKGGVGMFNLFANNKQTSSQKQYATIISDYKRRNSHRKITQEELAIVETYAKAKCLATTLK